MALERETPRSKPADHHDAGGGSSSISTSTMPPTASSTSAANVAAAVGYGASGMGSIGGGSGTKVVSIGKRRGNQYVEGVSVMNALELSGEDGGDGNYKRIITDGFFWKDVPELEGILQKFMAEYYEMRCVTLV